jgi:hypothetical protein
MKSTSVAIELVDMSKEQSNSDPACSKPAIGEKQMKRERCRGEATLLFFA